jgi:hypothetical protein
MNLHQATQVGGASMPSPRPSAPLKPNPIRGRRPVLQNCTLAELGVDPAYQRAIDNGASRALIRRIARDWDWSLCQPLVVAQREGAGLFVVDGQHRLAAAQLRGDILDLPCVISPYRDAAEEAAAFVALNQARKPLGAIELYFAALAGGDAKAVAVNRLMAEAGLSLTRCADFRQWRPGELANIGGIRRCHQVHGNALTGRALRIFATAFDGQVLRYAGTIFAGLWPVLAELGPSADDDLVTMVLGGDDQAGWMKTITLLEAEQGLHRQVAAQRAIRAAYDEAAAEMLEAAE